MNSESRDEIYKDLHGRQLLQQEAQNRESAHRILGILFEYARPDSVLDVGCGLGTWMSVASSLGVHDVHGIEGHRLDPSQLVVEQSLVTSVDLEQGFALNRRFDVAFCLEVAEHLSASAADQLVASLAAHTDVVLFSAAIPFQGGHHHVNEQFPDYWRIRFARHGFQPVDFIRPRIWNDPEVLWWLRQNTLLFAHDRAVAANEQLRQEAAIPRSLSVVHPDVYLSRLQQATRTLSEHAELVKLLSQGGTFGVVTAPGGKLTISRLNPATST
jgi:SAM-dependent methyltransferase